MKLGNKGFAISGILYSLLILFITLFIGTLTIFASSKFSFDKIKNDIRNKLETTTNLTAINFDFETYEINKGSVSTLNHLEGVSIVHNGETINDVNISYELPANYSLTTEGTYEIKYTATYNNLELTGTRKIIVKTSQPMKYSYTGSNQKLIINNPGLYQLEVWGAQGGYRSTTTYGGLGGYASGNINLKKNDNLYIYVGGAGGAGGNGCGTTICPGGFNGGGYRYYYYGGGGATDIRINENSLFARVLVAGGGGSDGSASKKGMYAGGTVGGSSTESYTAFSDYCGKGGTQTYSGYSLSNTIATQTTTGLNSNTLANYAGGFGFGGGGTYLSSGYGGAGGGGWYGGSGTIPDGSGDDDRGGGGGSGWAYTSANYTTWANANSAIKNNWLLNTDYYLISEKVLDGSVSMPNHASTTNMVGNSGNGVARITPLFIKY